MFFIHLKEVFKDMKINRFNGANMTWTHYPPPDAPHNETMPLPEILGADTTDQQLAKHNI